MQRLRDNSVPIQGQPPPLSFPAKSSGMGDQTRRSNISIKSAIPLHSPHPQELVSRVLTSLNSCFPLLEVDLHSLHLLLNFWEVKHYCQPKVPWFNSGEIQIKWADRRLRHRKERGKIWTGIIFSEPL